MNPGTTGSVNEILERSREDLEALRGARVFITGGTGFVGTWLVDTLVSASDKLGLDIRAEVLTRSPQRFRASRPELAERISLVAGDITDFAIAGMVDAAIHAATPASAALNDEQPELMRKTIEEGMATVLDNLEASGRIPFLFTSSGAVYGRQPETIEGFSETFQPAVNAIDPRNVYALGKRAAEELAVRHTAGQGPDLKLARLFAFAGPGLPLDTHFAIGNFIRDAIAGGPILVRGDGSAVRSYMYAGDLISALLAVLVRGETAVPYNVGSPHAVSMLELSSTVERVVAPGCGVTVAGLPPGELPTGAGNRYLPDVSRLTELMGRDPCPTDLEESIRRTEAWARNPEPTR